MFGASCPFPARVAVQSREKAFRFSLAGVQLKFSGAADAAGGLTIPASGVGGDWIVKLPARDYGGVPENEFSMMTLARQIGLSVPAIDLVDLASIQNLPNGLDHLGDKAFVIKRFDRAAQGAVHIEDFAQVFDLYARVAEAIDGHLARLPIARGI
ncbi:HipA domain-containing protein [Thiorhodovibrio frisius]|uniref:HipA domain-containing protein n=1 Tax=Thiorhodovibrio frisius TaxID=631362 RepID=UPI000A06377A|nr:HipA domain-containing protein [Thiorhodovibrio frisius]